MIPTFALAEGSGIPDLDNSTVETRATEDVSLLICPAGDGRRLDQAQTFGGGSMDATIELYLLDGEMFPIELFPFEDMWLQSPDLCFCNGGSNADATTDADGYTQFANPLYGGGCAEVPSLVVMVNGMEVGDGPIPFIKVNSPDMNCDLSINLVDLGQFASLYYLGYNYCEDFYWDGILNLNDVIILARHIGHSCP